MRTYVYILLFSFPILSSTCFSQVQRPLYVSLSYGTDLTTEKSNRILPYAPSFLGLSIEKRYPKKDFYGLGVNYFHFLSYYQNYQHLSLRGYQHFGFIEDALEPNIDPYFGLWGGVERWKNQIKTTVGIFVGVRFMFSSHFGIHTELGSASSGFGNGLLFTAGLTARSPKLFSLKRKHRATSCPKF